MDNTPKDFYKPLKLAHIFYHDDNHHVDLNTCFIIIQATNDDIYKIDFFKSRN